MTGHRRATTTILILAGLLLLVATATVRPAATVGAASVASPNVVAATAVTGMEDMLVVTGLEQPTAVAFLPDGRFFVAEKSGIVKLFQSLDDRAPTVFADLRTQVHNYWDRGLLGIAVPPDFASRPYLYVLYTYDAPPGATAPTWGTAGGTSDGCPTPPGPTDQGCVVQGRLSRIPMSGNQAAGPEQVLLTGWCQQFPSHSVGNLQFGADGALYVSGGEGANFNYADYGQAGNPCGDPPGGTMEPPTAEGGALRAQDLRTKRDPVGLSGAVLRLDPDTGAALADNPLARNKDANAQRIIAMGLRNPYRFALRPGTDELYIADVGWNDVEEIDRVTDVDDRTVENFGWPCKEGAQDNAAYRSLGLDICNGLYADGTAVPPFFQYLHRQPIVAGENCPDGSATVSGVAFGSPNSSYPAEYDGALFFADYSRGCIWALLRTPSGGFAVDQPVTVLTGASSPVQLLTGPGGDLYYVDIWGGAIHRVSYSSTSTLTCPTDQWKAEYFANPTMTGSPVLSQCEGAIDHDWGLAAPAPGMPADGFSVRWTATFAFDGGPYTFSGTTDDGVRASLDGALLFDGWKDQAATTYTADRTLTPGDHQLEVDYYENAYDAVARFGWTSADSPPTPVIDSPSSTLQWAVGDTIGFSGHADDPEDGPLPTSALSWSLILHHCPGVDCHTHTITSFTSTASGSFTAPDHEYPSYLELVLTATDSIGASRSTSVRLDPRTVDVSFATSPSGLQLLVGTSAATAPFTRTAIVGSQLSISAPTPQTLGGSTYDFESWSDGGAGSHDIIAPDAPVTYTARFTGTATSCPTAQYLATYFNNTTLSGSPVLTRCETTIDHDWGSGSPGPGVNADGFSVRWTGTFGFADGSYTFTATGDDGIRAIVDGQTVIDGWKDQPPTTYTASRTLTAGDHTVTVEFYENMFGAVANFAWG